MNIIWQQPNGLLAVTSIWDGSDPAEHAVYLQQSGNVPASWGPVAFGYTGEFPQAPHEALRWQNGAVVVDADAAFKLTVPLTVTRRQFIRALLASGLLDAVDAAVSTSGDLELQVEYAAATDFERANPLIAGIAASLGKSERDIDDLFILAGSL